MTQENVKEASWFDRLIFTILGWLKLTSGIGVVGLGGFWLLYGLLQFIAFKPENAIHQQVHEMFFLQAEIGLLIVAVGVLIMEVKKIQK